MAEYKAKEKKGFSRRHETSAEHTEARARYQAEHGPEARRTKAAARIAARATLTPKQQLEALNRRGARAVKERKRLEAQIKG